MWTHTAQRSRRTRRPYPVRTVITRTHTAQRSRRARRPYPVRTVITRSQGNTSCFQRLPAEVFHMILDRLSGLLFKRCTLLLPTEDRLTFTSSMFSQIPCFKLEECTAAGCLGFYGYGVFLKTMISGWGEVEWHRVFNFLCSFTNLLPKIKMAVTGTPGVSCSLELQLRLFCRQVLLDPWSSKDTLFWLTKILKPWPMVLQARLLFILYGPLLPDSTLAWQGMEEREMSHSALGHMAGVIVLLYSNLDHLTDWTTDTMQTILEELIDVWHMENVARLFVLCGSTVCYSFLANKAHNGQLLEASRLIVHIILVCEMDGYCMNEVVKMVHQVCQGFNNTSVRLAFIQSLEDMFSEVTMELIEIVTEGNHYEDMGLFQDLWSLLKSRAHFHAKFLHMFLQNE
ncbi:F-box only protein 47-like [Diretmus argenteus]